MNYICAAQCALSEVIALAESWRAER